jgi:hypothetical protein
MALGGEMAQFSEPRELNHLIHDVIEALETMRNI